jgi:hypothetical protein
MTGQNEQMPVWPCCLFTTYLRQEGVYDALENVKLGAFDVCCNVDHTLHQCLQGCNTVQQTVLSTSLLQLYIVPH